MVKEVVIKQRELRLKLGVLSGDDHALGDLLAEAPIHVLLDDARLIPLDGYHLFGTGSQPVEISARQPA
jgi:hypothetical protein